MIAPAKTDFSIPSSAHISLNYFSDFYISYRRGFKRSQGAHFQIYLDSSTKTNFPTGSVVLRRVGRYFKGQYPTDSLEELPVDSLPSPPPSQEVVALFKEREKQLETECGKLTERERRLWDFLRSGLSDKEIAEEIAERMSTTSNAIHQSKYKLIKKFQRLID